MKVAVVTGSTAEFRPVLDVTMPSKREYAAKHGYDLIEITFSTVHHLGFARLERAFDVSHGYDITLWIDGDSVITNQDVRVEDMAGDTPFTASLDWSPESPEGDISTGNFIIRPDYSFLEMVYYDEKEAFFDHPCQEQQTMNEVKKKWPSLFTVHPQNVLNSVPVQCECWSEAKPIVIPWQPGDFLAHLTATTNERRIAIAKELTA